MAGALLALPVWDHFHYSQSPNADAPIVSASLAGSPAPMPTAPPLPPANTATPTSAPAPSTVVPTPAPGSAQASARPVPSVASAAPPRPATTRPVSEPEPARSQAPPSSQGAKSETPIGKGASLQKSASTSASASSPMGFLGWLMGGSAPAAPTTPSPVSGPTTPSEPSQPSASPTPAPAPSPDETASLRLSVVPDRPTPARGETFTVAVVLSGAQDITSVPFHLQFDPGILQYLGARTGPALDGRSLQPIFLASVNPARPGDLAVGLSLVRSSGTFSGSGTIILLDFLALASGRSDLLFDRASVRGPTSAPLPAEIVGSAAEVR
jgi:cohesin domain-containing protein